MAHLSPAVPEGHSGLPVDQFADRARRRDERRADRRHRSRLEFGRLLDARGPRLDHDRVAVALARATQFPHPHRSADRAHAGPEGQGRARRARDSDNTIDTKLFAGGQLLMVGANAAADLRSTAVRYLFLDEVDAFPLDVEDEGDPVALAIQRTVSYRGRRKILMVSTPTIAGVSRIEKAYAETDQRKFFMPCPHCRGFQVLTWSHVRWPEGDPRAAYVSCEFCGGVIEEKDKPTMLAAGEWRATAPGDGRSAGFHLPSLLSAFEPWGEIAAEFLTVKGDPARLKSWVNLKLGEAFEDRDTAPVAADILAARSEDWGGELPEGVAVITAGVDTQDDRLEVEFVGWGRGEEVGRSITRSFMAIRRSPSLGRRWTGF